MSSSSHKFDDVLLAVAQQCGGIEDLLEVFFSFFQRKTDFFHIMTRPDDRLGFPPNRALDMIKASFEKHQLLYLTRNQPELLVSLKKSTSSENKETERRRSAKSVCAPVIPLSESGIPESVQSSDVSGTVDVQPPQKVSDKSVIPTKIIEESRNDRCRISTWNGGKSDLFWWGQSLNEATVDIVLPYPIIRSELKIDLKSSRLRVEYKGAVIIEGELFEPIQLDGSIWSIEDRSRVLITLEKGRENWWGSIIKGMTEIDLTKVESIKKIQDFDEETQVTLQLHTLYKFYTNQSFCLLKYTIFTIFIK